MGLDELAPFEPEKRIIEYCLNQSSNNPLVNLKLNDFSELTASESPAPGGGSISAYCGALGVSLGIMVANLSAAKKGWEDKWNYFSGFAEQGQIIRKQLIDLVDEDTKSFNAIMNAFQLPKGNEDEIKIRKNAIQEATRYAIEIPYRVMQLSLKSMEIIKLMAENGNPNSVTDAGVGALCARTAVTGAFMNVRINAVTCTDKNFVQEIIADGKLIEENAIKLEKEIIDIVEKTII
jgi:glutamate formiminotransferase/formiminotetrahydrofolate cyclodeaminase